jgi:beta-phosphoglucomutase
MKAFIFDLDGVIVDTAKYHYLAWRKMANGLGFDISLAQNEQLKGVSRIHSLQKILNWGNLQVSDTKFQELMTQKNDDYLSHVYQMDASEILPGVIDTLHYLKDQNQKIALGSASKNARLILEKTGLTSLFDTVVDGTNVQKAKPDPEVFLNAATQLNIPPKNCIVFEDAVAGIEAAKAGKMLAIGIGDPTQLSQADYIFQNFTQIHNEFMAKIIMS